MVWWNMFLLLLNCSIRLGLGEPTATSAPEDKLFKSHDKAPERGEDRFDISPFIFGSLFIRFAGDALPTCFSPGRTEITSPGPRPSSPVTSHNFWPLFWLFSDKRCDTHTVAKWDDRRTKCSQSIWKSWVVILWVLLQGGIKTDLPLLHQLAWKKYRKGSTFSPAL